jgi:hypothetical protein
MIDNIGNQLKVGDLVMVKSCPCVITRFTPQCLYAVTLNFYADGSYCSDKERLYQKYDTVKYSFLFIEDTGIRNKIATRYAHVINKYKIDIHDR